MQLLLIPGVSLKLSQALLEEFCIHFLVDVVLFVAVMGVLDLFGGSGLLGSAFDRLLGSLPRGRRLFLLALLCRPSFP